MMDGLSLIGIDQMRAYPSIWMNGYLNSFQAWSYDKIAFDKWSMQLAQRIGQLRNAQTSSK